MHFYQGSLLISLISESMREKGGRYVFAGDI